MINYKDGSFSDFFAMDEAMEKFREELDREVNPARSLHIGTESELIEIKCKKDIEYRVEELEDMVESLKPKKPSSIFAPTAARIKHVM